MGRRHGGTSAAGPRCECAVRVLFVFVRRRREVKRSQLFALAPREPHDWSHLAGISAKSPRAEEAEEPESDWLGSFGSGSEEKSPNLALLAPLPWRHGVYSDSGARSAEM